MEQEKLTAPRIADFAVQNLKLYEQYYFRTGSEVNFLTKPGVITDFYFSMAVALRYILSRAR